MVNTPQTKPSEQELGEVRALYDEYGPDYHVALLYMDTNKRWCLWETDEDGGLLDWEFQPQFTSGRVVEIMLGSTWLHARFEHGNGVYYLLVDDTVVTPHRGLYARVRRGW